MKNQEKKYRIDSFSKIQKVLDKIGVKKTKKNVTTHYYARQESNDVVKLVKYIDRSEIHVLKESQGRYSLKENVRVENIEAGLRWLKDKGYKTVNILKMVNTDYKYKKGVVCLYVIDDFLYSVILDFPQGFHEAVEKEFGLDTAEVISVPYDKFLNQIGRLRSMTLPSPKTSPTI